MEISEPLYIWLKQANCLLKPPTITSGKIYIQESDVVRLWNGSGFGRLLSRLNALYEIEDPGLNLIDTSSRSKILDNWNSISKNLESLGIDLDSNRKTLIVAGDRSLVFETLNEMIQLEIDQPEPTKKKHKKQVIFDGALLLGNLNPDVLLSDSENSLEFLLLNSCHAFSLKPKQAAGLMAEGGKYLGQVIRKGLKGDFEPVSEWFSNVLSNVNRLAALIEPDVPSGALTLVFRSIQYGLDCPVSEIWRKSALCLTILRSLLRFHEDEAWDWFVAGNVCHTVLQAHAVLRDEVCEHACKLLFVFGQKRLTQVFGEMMTHFYHERSFFRAASDFLKVFGTDQQMVTAASQEGLVQEWIEYALVDSSKKKGDRMPAVNFLSDIWIYCTGFVDTHEKYANSILHEIRRTDKEVSKFTKFQLIGKVFALLSALEFSKSLYADLVHKNLVLFLTENFRSEMIRDFILHNFLLIIREQQSFEISILLDALLKNYPGVTLNTFDFNFLVAVVRLPSLELTQSLELLDFLGNVYLNDFRYSTAVSIPLMMLISRLKEESVVQQFVHFLLDQGFRLILHNAKPSSTFRGFKDYGDDREAAHFRNLVLSLCEKVIKLGAKNLSESLKDLLLSYNNESKRTNMRLCKGINYLLDRLGAREKEREKPERSYEPSLRSSQVNASPLARAMLKIDTITKQRREITSKQRSLSEQHKLHEEKVKSSLKKQIGARRVELGIGSRLQEGEAMLLPRAQPKNQLLFFEPEDESEFEQDLLYVVTNQFGRVARVLFNKYVNQGFKPNVLSMVDNFDGTSEHKYQMKEAQAIKLLRENRVTKEMISTEQIKQVYAYVVKRYKSSFLTFEHFLSFMYQIALIVFRQKSVSDFSHFPSAISVKALYELFGVTEPETGDKDVINLLNTQLAKDPNVKMPEGYKRTKEHYLELDYTIPSAEEVPESFVIALEIIDEILSNAFQVHIIEPSIYITERFRAKAVLNRPQIRNSEDYFAAGVPANKAAYKVLPLPAYQSFTPGIKVQVLKMTEDYSNDLLLEIARLMDDLLHTVHERSPNMISRNPRAAGTIANPIKSQREEFEMMQQSLKEQSELKRRRRAAELQQELQKFQTEKEKKEAENLRLLKQRAEEERKRAKKPDKKKSKKKLPKPENFFQKERKKLFQYNQKKRQELQNVKQVKEPTLPDIPLEVVLKPLVENPDQFDRAWQDNKVKEVLGTYQKSLFMIFENYARQEVKGIQGVTMNLLAFNKFLVQFNIIPSLIKSESINSIFNSTTKQKKSNTHMNFTHFKQAVVKVALQASSFVDEDLGKKSSLFHEKLSALFEWMALPTDPKLTRDFIKGLVNSNVAVAPREKILKKNELVKQITNKFM